MGGDCRLEVTRFGQQEPLEVTAGDVLTFPEGLVGMPDLHQFVVADDPRTSPCRWLQSLEEPALAFVVVDPRVVVPDYTVTLSEEDRTALGLDAGDAGDPWAVCDVWAIVTLRAQPAEATVNLLAPVVVTRERRTGRQVVLRDSNYLIRHPIGTAPPDEAGQAAGRDSEAPANGRDDGGAGRTAGAAGAEQSESR